MTVSKLCTFHRIFLSHQHRQPISKRQVSGGEVIVIRERMRDYFQSGDAQTVKKAVGITDSGDSVNR